MSDRRFSLAVAALISILFSVLAVAQAPGRIETRTRLVSLFSDLQNQWLEAVKKKDAAALDRLLGDEYEVWTATHNGPIPREDWQAEAFAQDLKSFRTGNMAVRTVRDDVAVESFVLEQTVSKQGAVVQERSFVVNVWTNGKDGWRCTDSYWWPITGQPSPHSAPVSPTGKD